MLDFGTLLLLWSLLQQGFGLNVSQVTTENLAQGGTTSTSTTSPSQSSLSSSSSSSPDTGGITYPTEGSSCQNGQGSLPLQWQQTDGLCCRCQFGIVECYDIAQLGCPKAPENTTGCTTIDICGCSWWVCEGMLPAEYDYSNTDGSWSLEDSEEETDSLESNEELSDEDDSDDDDSDYSGQGLSDELFYGDWRDDGDDDTNWDYGDQIPGNYYPGYPKLVRRRRSVPYENGGGHRFLHKRPRIARDERSTVKNDGKNTAGSERPKGKKVLRPGKRGKGQIHSGPRRGAKGQLKRVRKTQGNTPNTSKDGQKIRRNPKNGRNGGDTNARDQKKRLRKNQNNKRLKDKSRRDGARDGPKGVKRGKPNGKANRNEKGTPQNRNARVIRRNRNGRMKGMEVPPGLIRARVKIMQGKQNNPRAPNGKRNRDHTEKNGKNRNGHEKKQKQKNKRKNNASKNGRNERHGGKSKRGKHRLEASAVASDSGNQLTPSGDSNQEKKQSDKSVFGGPTDDELDIFSGDYTDYGSSDSAYDSAYSYWYNDFGFNDNSSHDNNYSDYYYNYYNDWFDSRYPNDPSTSNYDDYNNYDDSNYNYYDYSHGSLGSWNYPYGYDMEWYVPRSMWNFPNCNCNCGGDNDDDDDDDDDNADDHTGIGDEDSDEDSDETEVSDYDVTVTTGIPPTTVPGTSSVDVVTVGTNKSIEN